MLINCTTEKATIYSERTIAENRNSFHKKLIHETIESTLQSDNQEKWLGAFWGMGLSQYRSPITDNFFDEKIDSFYRFPIDIQCGFLETVYGLYPAKYQENLESQLSLINNPKTFAMIANYIYRNNSTLDNFILN